MRTKFIGIVMLTGLLLSSSAAVAQSDVEGRVDRLEREMRAVQRKVFPGGNGQYFPPDISPQTSTGTPAPGSPATTPVADINARISAVESQLTTLTGQIEQNQFRLQQFEEAFAAYKRTTDARLKALEDTATATGGTAGAITPAPATPSATKPVTATSKPVTPPKVTPTAAPVPVDPNRARLVATVAKPLTDDPADDLYVYGYRLWQTKLYPEAQSQLKQVVSKYPTSRRASWAQNLLGRSYLDEGKPSLASLAFYENYKKFPDGERAPDSLFFLTVALKKLGKPSADICQVYDELSEVYATKITAQMKDDIARGRATEKCKAS
ncbi:MULTISPECIES: tol-pal system YbgF family protein [unclassified Sphingomonas]|uniref:tol-pal system YbgF family protein n=1 Tax=unclassified Sphingomonas TaxID=196159 RepID=UPI000BD705EC|nr:MAG: hypothetical protein B7Z43_04665 [Sphingomonas sp. 12-62-6]OYX39487.1 MAG: hypothetical protein B7Y98_04920 [Sphingomonas sp. 32-62-10]